jgi:hypothetical protein
MLKCLGGRKQNAINMIVKIGEGHIFPRKVNRSFDKENYII